MTQKPRAKKKSPLPRAREGARGRLRIGDNWNAITIIALSQNNPLKAIAEFVENSIDARARTITIIRGKEHGESYLKIIDDGEGIPRDPEGKPDFRYVATHIGDSLKRRLKENGVTGIQGEFGVGLLSFWTVGERLTLSSPGADGRTWQMDMTKSEPGYCNQPAADALRASRDRAPRAPPARGTAPAERREDTELSRLGAQGSYPPVRRPYQDPGPGLQEGPGGAAPPVQREAPPRDRPRILPPRGDLPRAVPEQPVPRKPGRAVPPGNEGGSFPCGDRGIERGAMEQRLSPGHGRCALPAAHARVEDRRHPRRNVRGFPRRA